MLIVNNPTDQITSLIWGLLSTSPFHFTNPLLGSYDRNIDVFFGFLHPLSTTEPLYFLLMSLLGSLLGGNAYNLYLVAILLLNFFVFYYVFKHYKFWWFGCAIYNLSSYYYLHLGLHPSLIHLWIFPLFYKFYTDKNKWGLILLAPVTALLSNYFGYILLLSYGLLTLSTFIFMQGDFKSRLRS